VTSISLHGAIFEFKKDRSAAELTFLKLKKKTSVDPLINGLTDN
jgi:hypothetical protein